MSLVYYVEILLKFVFLVKSCMFFFVVFLSGNVMDSFVVIELVDVLKLLIFLFLDNLLIDC